MAGRDRGAGQGAHRPRSLVPLPLSSHRQPEAPPLKPPTLATLTGSLDRPRSELVNEVSPRLAAGLPADATDGTVGSTGTLPVMPVRPVETPDSGSVLVHGPELLNVPVPVSITGL